MQGKVYRSNNLGMHVNAGINFHLWNNCTLNVCYLGVRSEDVWYTVQSSVFFFPCHVHPQSGRSQQRCLAEPHPFILIELIAGRASPIMITYLPSNGVYKRDVSKQISGDGDKK